MNSDDAMSEARLHPRSAVDRMRVRYDSVCRTDIPHPQGFAVLLFRFLRVFEHGHAAGALEAELRAGAVVGRGSSDNRGVDLNNREDMVVLRERRWILPSHVPHGLKQRAGLRVDHTE